MLAVTVNRTIVYWGNKHLCMTHKCKVDKHHIDSCDHLKLNLKVTEFNEEKKTIEKSKWKPERL